MKILFDVNSEKTMDTEKKKKNRVKEYWLFYDSATVGSSYFETIFSFIFLRIYSASFQGQTPLFPRIFGHEAAG